MFMAASCGQICGKLTYQETVAYYMGPLANFLCNIFIIIHNWGTCITMLVILADQIDQSKWLDAGARYFFFILELRANKEPIFPFPALYFTYGPDFCIHWYMDRTFTLPVVTAVLIFPFCFPVRMNTFKFVRWAYLMSQISFCSITNAISLSCKEHDYSRMRQVMISIKKITSFKKNLCNS